MAIIMDGKLILALPPKQLSMQYLISQG